MMKVQQITVASILIWILSIMPAQAQTSNNSFLVSSNRIASVPNIHITVSIICVDGLKFVQDITYKAPNFSTNMTQMFVSNNQPIPCYDTDRNSNIVIDVP